MYSNSYFVLSPIWNYHLKVYLFEGQKKLKPEGYCEGAPQADSSKASSLNEKAPGNLKNNSINSIWYERLWTRMKAQKATECGF